MATITLKQREAKNLKFECQHDGVGLNLSGARFFLGVKRTKDDLSYILFKYDGDFNKAQAADGTVTVFFTQSDTNRDPGVYVGELRIEFLDGSVERSEDLQLVIEKAITD